MSYDLHIFNAPMPDDTTLTFRLSDVIAIQSMIWDMRRTVQPDGTVVAEGYRPAGLILRGYPHILRTAVDYNEMCDAWVEHVAMTTQKGLPL